MTERKVPADGRYVIERSIVLKAPAEEVWARSTSLAGINAELQPWLVMSEPPGVERLDLTGAVIGEPLFTSKVHLFDWLPVDQVTVTLEALEPGRHFVQTSNMHSMTWWRHARTIEPLGPDRCRLTDRIDFTPKTGGGFMRAAYDALWRHRHGVLKKTFGA